MTVKLGINGFGRIGKLVARAALASGGIEIVGINDLMKPCDLAHLMKYDSTQGRFDGEVSFDDNSVTFNGNKIRISSERDPANLKWDEVGADVVLESTGIFATSDALKKHISAGAKKVLLSVPPKDKNGEIKLIVLGVNDDSLTAEDTLVSNASCTTNCLAPMAKVLNNAFGIEKGLITTIHSYTNDQKILDQAHSDMRRARAGALNMIPTTTGAARAVGQVIPELNGKLDGMAIRVPVGTGSCTDLVAILKQDVTIEQVNKALKDASEGPMKGILEYTEDPIVSSDIVHNPHSSIIDALSTSVMEGNMVKIISWYDNEWGYSNRCVDLIKKMAT
jgi:glyceraldehyde 3-phosphate dehydrogenase